MVEALNNIPAAQVSDTTMLNRGAEAGE